MKRDTLIQLLDIIGLKKPLSWLHFELQTLGLPKTKPRILRTLPHDPDVYTQGLAFYHGQLYESTGLVGKSRLRCLNHRNGDVQQEIKIEQEWCEGIAILNDNLVQLTYTSGRAMIYDPASLKQHNSEFRYEGEGWGLASCGDCFVMSNGSDELTFRNKQFIVTSTLPVEIRSRPLRHINDLECVGNSIFANVQFDNSIYEIDRVTGKVLRVIDCREIVNTSGRHDFQDMLNGIAYLPETGTFFVTGKNWPTLFEIYIT